MNFATRVDELRVWPSADEVRRLFAQFSWYEKSVLALIAVAAWSPYGPTTASGIANPDSYQSLWNIRPVAGLNLFELAAAAIAFVVVARPDRRRILSRRCVLDLPILAFATVVVGLDLLAHEREAPIGSYWLVDAERVGCGLAGYALVSRLRPPTAAFMFVVPALAVVLVVRAASLTVRHGILGSTEFGTLTGASALLITEDVLLVAFPVLLGWGLLVDGHLSRRATAAVLGLLGASVAVQLASLRRGALIFLGLGLALRTLGVPIRTLRRAFVIALVALAAFAVTAPGQSAVDALSYTAESSLLRTDDESTSQREAELRSYGDNARSPADLLTGKGLGAVWTATEEAPVDIAAFGSGETAYVRLGWHVYGLDWLYKFGLIGVLGLIAVALAGRRVIKAAVDSTTTVAASYVRSLIILTPILTLFLFTNLRLATFAGVCAGLLSLGLDRARETVARAR